MSDEKDRMHIKILEDGTIQVTTGEISAPNHMNAETFQKEMGKLCGGEVSRVRRTDANIDLHDVLHDHMHEEHHH